MAFSQSRIDAKHVGFVVLADQPGRFRIKAKVTNDLPGATYFGFVEVRPFNDPDGPPLETITVRLVVP
jgi:hypothetical protein